MSSERPTYIRHYVLWLTVAAYMITYMDRVVMSAAAPSIQKEFGFSLATMSTVIAAFRWGYSFFQIPGAWLGDVLGPRRALTMVVTWWSLFTSITAFAWNATSMIAFRFLFGLGEAGAFPIATRSLSRWMLPTERGWAQGVTHAGSRLGATLTPPIVVFLIAGYGWRMPFYVFGSLGVIWAAIWYYYYRDRPQEHSAINKAELDLIEKNVPASRAKVAKAVPWRAILTSSNVWTLSAMYFCYGYGLAVYLDWFPSYLYSHRGFDLKKMGFYASLPLLAGTIGDLIGGWLSDHIGKRTGNLRMARKAVAITGFLIAAVFTVPAMFTADPYHCVWFTCAAFFGLELTVGVSWAVPLDVGGDFAGSVSSVMNTCGNIGGAIAAQLFGTLVQSYGWDRPFVVAAVLCVLGALLFARIDPTKQVLATE